MRVIWGMLVICFIFFAGITYAQEPVSSEKSMVEVNEEIIEKMSEQILLEEKLHYEQLQGQDKKGYLLTIAKGIETIFQQTHQFVSSIIYEVANTIIG